MRSNHMAYPYVIPAQAGIHKLSTVDMDSRFRGNDNNTSKAAVHGS